MVETGISNLGASANNRAQTPTRAGATTESASFRSNGYPGGGRVTAFQGVGAGGASQRDNDRGRTKPSPRTITAQAAQRVVAEALRRTGMGSTGVCEHGCEAKS
ncbi:hypothetical protein CUJ88_20135 [Paraburkholderia hospita]|nr:hypothetical protein CUJ88_20135 [Paraburkholderia hospita]